MSGRGRIALATLAAGVSVIVAALALFVILPGSGDGEGHTHEPVRNDSGEVVGHKGSPQNLYYGGVKRGVSELKSLRACTDCAIKACDTRQDGFWIGSEAYDSQSGTWIRVIDRTAFDRTCNYAQPNRRNHNRHRAYLIDAGSGNRVKSGTWSYHGN